jgi:hypothetical protein
MRWRRVFRVEDAGVVVLPVHAGDVVRSDRPPVDLPSGGARPSLDSGEHAFDARAVAVDDELGGGGVVGGAAAVGLEHRHEVFRAGEHVDIGFSGVLVLGQALVGLPSDSRQRQAPAEAEGTVAGAGVVGERKLRPEPGPPGAGGDRH